MISNFTLKNLTTQTEVTFGQNPSTQFVFKDGDLDWGSATARHNTYTYPAQVGVYISSTNVGGRDISLVGYAYYIPSDKDRLENPTVEALRQYAYSKILSKKNTLSKIVNPEQFVRVSIGDYYIDGKPNSDIIFGSTSEDNNEYFCKFLISIFCNNPMFRKNVPLKSAISSTIPRFKFPLIMSQRKPVVFGVRRNYQLLAVENEGDTPIGCKIIASARGELKNPTFMNVTSGEQLVISKTLVDTEKVIINTVQGERSVTGVYNQVEHDYFMYWDYENTWLQLPVGTSLIGYTLEEGDPTLLEVEIEVIPLKYRLEEM